MHAQDLQDLARQWPVHALDTPQGRIGYRRAGDGPWLVLLHGIGSASGSWLRQLQALSRSFTVLAWEAPGYGCSDPVAAEQPAPADYAGRLWSWLDALAPARPPIVLAGHSLGCLMAAAAAGLRPQQVRRLVLLAPAQGYGLADPALRQARLADRLDMLARLGPTGLAAQRGAAMLSPQADPGLRAYVQSLMAAIRPAGYTQAAHLLADADLAGLLAAVGCPVTVASGSADTITPAAGCSALAARVGAPYLSLGPVGHACALEAADAVNGLLLQTPTEPDQEPGEPRP